MKEKVYNFTVRAGLKILGAIFPSVHYKQPLKPSDRYLEYHFVFSHLPEDRNINILDIGSSGSFFPLIVSALGYQTTGCDPRPYEILNNLEFKNFQFIQQDICKNQLPAESFDVITCVSVLEHIGLKGRYGVEEDPEGDIKMAREIGRLLKPSGIALITVPYGIAEIFAPYHRIYDLARVRRITSYFEIKEEKIYCLDKNRDWKNCIPDEGQLIRGGIDHYGLALLCLKKPITRI